MSRIILKGVLRVYGIGLCVLSGAILFNVLIKLVDMTSWYDVMTNESLYDTVMSVPLIDSIFLLVIYPLFLGFIAFIAYEHLHDVRR